MSKIANYAYVVEQADQVGITGEIAEESIKQNVDTPFEEERIVQSERAGPGLSNKQRQ